MSDENSGLIDAALLRPAAPVDTDPVVVDTGRGGTATVRR
jgi:hypothetical protein